MSLHARRSGALRAASLALLLALGARPAAAQADLVLRDADVPALTALLRADAARAEAMQRRVAGIPGEVEAELRDIRAAAEDPLAHVRARTAHYVVPPDARYDAGCSRSVSSYVLAPRAVFAIGRADEATAAALQRNGTARLSGPEAYELMRRQGAGSAGQAQAATMQWYQARGFRISGTVAEAAPLRWGGPTPDPLAVTVHMTNAVASLGAECAALGNTAVLVLAIDERAAGGGRGAAAARKVDPVEQADSDFEGTLARFGVASERYHAMLAALWQAQKEVDVPGEAEQSDAMARIPGMEAMGNARRQNRAWFARHRAALLPLLERYGRALGAG